MQSGRRAAWGALGEVKGGPVPAGLGAPSVLHTTWSTKADRYWNGLCPFLMAGVFSPILMVEAGEGTGVKFQARVCSLGFHNPMKWMSVTVFMDEKVKAK